MIKEIIESVCKTYKVSKRKACLVLGFHRKTIRYQHVIKVDALNYDFLDFPMLTKNHGMLSSYVSFKEVYGYEWGYTVIDFIVNRYGKNRLANFLRKPDDFVGVFGVTEEQFWEE